MGRFRARLPVGRISTGCASRCTTRAANTATPSGPGWKAGGRSSSPRAGRRIATSGCGMRCRASPPSCSRPATGTSTARRETPCRSRGTESARPRRFGGGIASCGRRPMPRRFRLSGDSASLSKQQPTISRPSRSCSRPHPACRCWCDVIITRAGPGWAPAPDWWTGLRPTATKFRWH